MTVVKTIILIFLTIAVSFFTIDEFRVWLIRIYHSISKWINNNFNYDQSSRFKIDNSLKNEVDRHIPSHVRHEVWRRDRGCCTICGSQKNLEFDHIIPVSKGGSNTTRNIQLFK